MKLISVFILSIFALLGTSQLFGHCQVPCGIYTDQLRFEQMLEDQSTIEKAAKMINELSAKEDALSHNQLSRWVATKEAHANAIQKTVTEYFLIQRIKSSAKNYEAQLISAHSVLVAAMKCKQTLDPTSSKNLKDAILQLHKDYEGKK
ncbi:MAG: hypothetical protein CMI27_04575 [Opitutae bacterium]|nr:hypothetical protein [Opitutae bacterium]